MRSSTRCSDLALALLASGSIASLAASAQAVAPVPFPRGYREWTHVKTLAVTDEKHALFKVFPGLHHVYANQKAVQALKAGGPFPDGAALVLDALEISDSTGAMSEGPRKLLAVMVRDTERFKATEGWGFEVFGKGKKEVRGVKSAADAKACLDCHQQRAAQHFVFSELRP